MPLIPDFGIIILCGGESRRMGFPKALLPFGSQTMLEFLVHKSLAIASEIVVVSSPGQKLPSLPPKVRLIEDQVAYQGPLTGMKSGLSLITKSIKTAFITATDSPLIMPELIEFLYSRMNANDIVMPFDGKYHYPLTSIYRVQPVLNQINTLLSENRHRPFFLLESLQSNIISTTDLRTVDPNLCSFRNINTPMDYREILRIANLPVPFNFQAPKINMEFYGVPRLRTGVHSFVVEAETVDELIRELSRLFPQLIHHVICNHSLHPAYRLMRGTTEFLTDPSTILNPDDQILLLSVDAGG